MIDKTKILNKLIRIIKPDNMSKDEYIIQCAVRGINVSLDDSLFMRWVITEAYSKEEINSERGEKVRDIIIECLKHHIILDFSIYDDCRCVIEALSVALTHGIDTRKECERLFNVILEEYRNTSVGIIASRLNKGFGVVSTYSFHETFKEALKSFNL